MIDKIKFAQKLVNLRNKCGLSQSKLADMLYISGQAVSKWENSSSLPDIELLYPLSQILGVSADYLLGNDSNDFTSSADAVKESVTAYDISDENINLLSAMSSSLSREYLFKTAKYIEKDLLEYKVSLELTSSIDGTKNYYKRELDLQTIDKDSLAPFSKQLANLTLQAINNGYNPVQNILGLMKCPECGKDFEYFKTSEEEYISCGEHRFDVNDGVVDFKTLEIHGYTWSSWIRCYDDFKKKFCPEKELWNPKSIDDFGEFDKHYIRELQKNKPPVILEIGSGVASGIKKFTRAIDWECTVILTDLSHRILKYSKRYIDENLTNPHVKFVYLACNVKNLPFRDESLPCILSYGGYCSLKYSFKDSFFESRRILKTGGEVMTDMGIVSDREDKNVQKWLKLMKDCDDSDIRIDLYNHTYDVKEWHKLIKEFGFKDYTFIKTADEVQAPDTDVFPYNYEIARWMGLAFISAIK